MLESMGLQRVGHDLMTEQQVETSTSSQVAEIIVKRAIFKAVIIAPGF